MNGENWAFLGKSPSSFCSKNILYKLSPSIYGSRRTCTEAGNFIWPYWSKAGGNLLKKWLTLWHAKARSLSLILVSALPSSIRLLFRWIFKTTRTRPSKMKTMTTTTTSSMALNPNRFLRKTCCGMATVLDVVIRQLKRSVAKTQGFGERTHAGAKRQAGSVFHISPSTSYNNQEIPLLRSLPMQDRIAYQGITFDDVFLEPAYSEVLPRDVDVRTQLTRNIRLNIPVLSSPMDTVTESELAIALAQEGGLGVIHRNMSIAQQPREVAKVKRSENGIITDPVTLPPDETVGTARRLMDQQHISGVPITVDGNLRGIITRRDLRFLTNNTQRISEVMTRENLVTAPEHTTLEAAE